MPSLMMSALTIAVGFLSVVSAGLLAWGWHLLRALRRVRAEAFRARQPDEDIRRDQATLRRSHALVHERWQRAQTQALLTERELVALTYSISHDLRAPLRGIDGFSQALLEDYGSGLDATAQGYLARVRANSQELQALIDDLLALAQIARAPFRPEPVDVSGLAREIAAKLSASEPSRPVRWEIPADVLAVADRALLAEALRQLFANAWRFTSARDVALITFRALPPEPARPGAVVYQVCDNGVGFDAEYAGRLFGAFQRMHAPEEFPAGRGIGLALVQRIVHRHGGEVWADSAPGQGARFAFTLTATGTPGTAEKTPSDGVLATLGPGHGTADASAPRTTTV